MAFSSENLGLTAPTAAVLAGIDDYTGGLAPPAVAWAGSFSLSWDGVWSAPAANLSGDIDLAWDGALVVPQGVLVSTLDVGQTFDGALTLSPAEFSATLMPSVSATLVAPACTLSGLIYPEIDWSSALQLPLLTVYATGAAVVTTTFDTWSMNTRTAGAATYTTYPFTSYFRLGSNYYGCAADGIYLLSGEDDAGAPIAAHTLHGISDFNSSFRKWVDSVYLNVRGTGGVEARMLTDEVLEVSRQTAALPDGLRTLRLKIGRSPEGRSWQLRIANVGGSHFTVSEARITPIKLSRRV